MNVPFRSDCLVFKSNDGVARSVARGCIRERNAGFGVKRAMAKRGDVLRVAIVGAGLGGLTLALALARRGFASTVLERSAVLAEVGAGVQLSPNAVKCLFSLGLEAEVLRIAAAAEAVEVRDHVTRALLMATPLGTAAQHRWGAPYLQAHRADLQAVLRHAVERAGGVVLQLGAECASYADDAVTTLAGERHRCDLVVGCDGLRSSVRRQVIGDPPARFTGNVAWRATVPAEDVPVSVSMTTTAVWTGSERHFVHYPIRAGRLLNVIAVTEEQGWRVESWSQAGDRDQLLAAFYDWPDPVVDIIAASQGVMRWGVYDRAPLRGWTRGRVTLLGDAAHPMSPFLAQGACMAIEDAVVLARALAAERTVEVALARYERARKVRTSKAQAWSRRNARLFHLPQGLAQGVFGAARRWDQLRGVDAAARLDWLYGYDAVTAHI